MNSMRHLFPKKYFTSLSMSRLLLPVVAWLLTFFLSTQSMDAQELNCQVEFNTDQIQTTNKSVFETLKEAVTEYMNETHFTNLQFATNERIDCRIFFTIKEYTDNKMVGDLQVQVSRPVYNTSYTTTLLNFKDDKIEFEYQEGEPLTFSLNTMESQLTAILNFYAYLFIAIDSDSFAPKVGSRCLTSWRRLSRWPSPPARPDGRLSRTSATVRRYCRLLPIHPLQCCAICFMTTTVWGLTRWRFPPTRGGQKSPVVSTD